MASFTKNKTTGRFDVIGTVDEIHIGPVEVQKRDGETKTVYIYKVGKPFTAKFGALAGQQCRIGTVGRADYQGARNGQGTSASSGKANGGPRKRCWECGRSFSYAECRANDGDWGDSYCGC